jgi:hypothetical protein
MKNLKQRLIDCSQRLMARMRATRTVVAGIALLSALALPPAAAHAGSLDTIWLLPVQSSEAPVFQWPPSPGAGGGGGDERAQRPPSGLGGPSRPQQPPSEGGRGDAAPDEDGPGCPANKQTLELLV